MLFENLKNIASVKFSNSKFIKDAYSLSYGIFLAQLIGLISMPIVTRLYEPSDFGRFSFTMALVGIFGFMGTFRLEAIIPSVKNKIESLIIVQAIFIISIIFTISVMVVFLIIKI